MTRLDRIEEDGPGWRGWWVDSRLKEDDLRLLVAVARATTELPEHDPATPAHREFCVVCRIRAKLAPLLEEET